MARIVGIEHVQLAMPVGLEDRVCAFHAGLLGLARMIHAGSACGTATRHSLRHTAAREQG